MVFHDECDAGDSNNNPPASTLDPRLNLTKRFPQMVAQVSGIAHQDPLPH